MEQDASAFAAAVDEATDKLLTHAIQQLKGRFRFVWGMYKAHSEVGTIRTVLYGSCSDVTPGELFVHAKLFTLIVLRTMISHAALLSPCLN